VSTYDLNKVPKQFARLVEILEQAWDDGHAAAMDACAKTDEQRLQYISELVEILNRIQSHCPVSVQDEIRALIGRRHQVQIISFADAERISKQLKQMNQEYQQTMHGEDVE